jgi:plasmid stability protein
MRTLYLRNVPDEVIHRLEVLARQAGTSVAAVAVRELAEASRRADNPALLEGLPDLGLPPEILVDVLAAGRAQR